MPAESSSATGTGVILYSQPPMLRTIMLVNQSSGNIDYVQLAFPHVLYGLFYFRTERHPFMLKKLNVMFGPEPFTGAETDKVYGLPLRNHDGAFATCFYNWPTSNTEEEFVETVVNQYWGSPFIETNDWASFWSRRYASKNPQFLPEWIQATKDKKYEYALENPMLASDYVVSVGKLIEANKANVATDGVKIKNWVLKQDLVKEIQND